MTKYIIRTVKERENKLFLKEGSTITNFTVRAREAKRFDTIGAAMNNCAHLNSIFGDNAFEVISTKE